MNAIIPVPSGALVAADEAAVRAYALAEKADATRRAYHADFSLLPVVPLPRRCGAWGGPGNGSGLPGRPGRSRPSPPR